MNTRKVVVYGYDRSKTTNGRYEKVAIGHGTFHQFGIDYEEFDTGLGQFTTAVVEMPDGSVRNVPLEMIVFNT